MKLLVPKDRSGGNERQPEEILTKSQLAERLQVSVRTICQWQRSGRLPYIRISRSVRYRWSAVLAHLEKFQVS
jgi:excisionase family DNA binding protein